MRRYLNRMIFPVVFVCILWGAHPLQGRAQDGFRPLIEALDANSVTLGAYRKHIEALKVGNLTGLNPVDPRVEVELLRPSPRLGANRLVLSVSQEFEFPTVYGRKRQVVKQQNQLIETDYHVFRAEFLQEAIQAYLRWIHVRQLGVVLQEQAGYASQIAEAYQRSFVGGQVSVLERNKARIHAQNTQKSFELNEIERHTAYEQLLRYNNGLPLENLPEAYPMLTLPVDVQLSQQQAISENNSLNGLTQEISLSETQEKLSRAQWLPNISVGYVQERDLEADFRGASFGLTIPLWQNRNAVRHAKLQTQALEGKRMAMQQQYTLELNSLHARSVRLQQVVNELRQTVGETRGLDLVKRALDLGEITLLDYLLEQSLYLELTEKLLQAENELYMAIAEMQKWAY